MSRTVMIVDDVPFVRKTLSEILTAAHFTVVAEAADGKEAIEHYIKLQPDLVTMDVVMPNMSGIEATRKLVKADKNAKIVMVSAMGQESLIMEAINAGAKDYVLKPFDAEEIVKTLEHVLTSSDAMVKRTSVI